MGGKGPSMPAPQPVPAAPAPIDYDKMAAASIRVAQAQTAAEEEAIKRLYPEYIRMQFGTADQLAGRLDNDYLARTRGVIGEELQAASVPNAIEAMLQRDAEAELALGRSLSPEQTREATQSARAAMAARGLGTSMAGTAAEILNRDAYGTARQDQRPSGAPWGLRASRARPGPAPAEKPRLRGSTRRSCRPTRPGARAAARCPARAPACAHRQTRPDRPAGHRTG